MNNNTNEPTKEEVYANKARSTSKKKIEKIHADEKAKNFFSHLVRAYMPATKIQNLFMAEGTETEKCTCSICNAKLYTKEQVLAKMLQTPMEDVIANFKAQINEDEKAEPLMAPVVKGKRLAWQGDKTTTTLCQFCAEELVSFIVQKVLENDPHITWLLKDVRRQENKKNFKNVSKQKTKKPVVKRAQSSISDSVDSDTLSALEKMKAQMVNS